MKIVLGLVLSLFMVSIVVGQQLVPTVPKTDVLMPYTTNIFSATVEMVVSPNVYLIKRTGDNLKFYVKVYGVSCPKQTDSVGIKSLEYSTKLLRGQEVAISAMKKELNIVISKVYYKNQDVGVLLVKNGLGKMNSKATLDKDVDLTMAQEIAKSKKLGIWSLSSKKRLTTIK